MLQRIPLRGLPIQFNHGNQVGTESFFDVDVEALEAALQGVIKGGVHFDPATRGMYAHGASIYRMVPLGVVTPLHAEDVIAAVAVAREFKVPVLSRGGGTSIAGQESNFALILDFSRHMSGIGEIDVIKKEVWVMPGTVLDELRNEARKHGLTFGPDPATHSRCTLGGMIGNNSCGIHSVVAGRTSDNVEELDILTYEGERMVVGATTDDQLAKILQEGGAKGKIYKQLIDLRRTYADLIRERFPKIPRRVSGFNLDELLPEKGFNVARSLVGSEGTCVTILAAKVKLIEIPNHRVILVLGFPDQPSAGHFVSTCLKFKPLGCEGIDAVFFEKMRLKGMEAKHLDLLPEGKVWLLVEFGGDTVEGAADRARGLQGAAVGAATANLCIEPSQQRHIWDLREAGLGATAHVPGQKENWEGWEDTAVAPERLGHYLHDFQQLMTKFGYTGSFYGHYGDGCVHVRIDFDLRTAHGIAEYRRFVEEGADLVRAYNGSLTGEHGDGQSRGELLTRMFGPELIQGFAEFKRIWDPNWRMNPGKLVAPTKLDEDLVLGSNYQPQELKTHFQYPHDRNAFSEVALRCVGAGVCRRKEGGVMCPSYQITHEEQHSTRGRARMLFEMVKGEVILDGWKSEEVKKSLDLCLSCKGCKSDCPVQVDMATYRAEFLAHYYENRPRPPQAYAFGYIHLWSRFAAFYPAMANLMSRTSLMKRYLGIAPERQMPRFAQKTFKRLARSRKPSVAGETVILWPDTFNNHFHPETAIAALEVLERAGFSVVVPKADMCCGRPLYECGLLDVAKENLLRILKILRAEIRKGVPIIVLEPSCAAVFRDELRNLFPFDEDAIALSKQTFLLSEFLVQRGYEPPKMSGKAIVHWHCHHRSIMGVEPGTALLTKTGLDFSTPEEGCCGMAGAFGFEEGERYDLSIKCGERALVPAVKASDSETWIIADGFSCREQIRQATGQSAVHMAELLNEASRKSKE